jgi:hypothetical protein
MLVGAAIYSEAYPAMKASILNWGVFGKVTLPTGIGVSPWFIIPILIVLYLLLFALFEKKDI